MTGALVSGWCHVELICMHADPRLAAADALILAKVVAGTFDRECVDAASGPVRQRPRHC